MKLSYAEIAAALTVIFDAVTAMPDEEMLEGDKTVLDPLFRQLDTLAAQDVAEETVEQVLHSSELTPVLAEISRLRNLYNLRLEIEQAQALLEAPDPWAIIQGFTFYPNYLRLAAMEQQGAALRPGDRITFLGSGPLPLSLIMLCSEYGLSGLGIERDRSSAELSRCLLHHLGLAERISIVEGDHFSLPLPEKSTLLMVAAMARPKEEIFAHLAEVLPADSLVSFRLYEKGLRRILDQEEDFFLPDVFSQHCRISPKPPVNNTVVMVRKNFRNTPAD